MSDSDGWYWIQLPDATYGVQSHLGAVRKTPPIAQWAIGMQLDDFLTWVAKKGGSSYKLREDPSKHFDRELERILGDD